MAAMDLSQGLEKTVIPDSDSDAMSEDGALRTSPAHRTGSALDPRSQKAEGSDDGREQRTRTRRRRRGRDAAASGQPTADGPAPLSTRPHVSLEDLSGLGPSLSSVENALDAVASAITADRAAKRGGECTRLAGPVGDALKVVQALRAGMAAECLRETVAASSRAAMEAARRPPPAAAAATGGRGSRVREAQD